MKKLTVRQRAHFKRKATKRSRNTRRLVARLKLASEELEGRITSHSHFLKEHGLPQFGRTSRATLMRYPILLPEVLSLRDNYEETVASIEELRDAALNQHRSIMLYFDRLTSLEPAATLLLTAEIYRCKNLRPARNGLLVNGNYPTDNSIILQLSEMGFYRLIDVPELDNVLRDDEADRPYFVPFRTFKGVDPQFAATFCTLVSHGAFNLGELALGRMVGALKEAMGNSEEHAYRGETGLPTMKGRWWVTGYIDPGSHEMMIVFFDQGVGIPKTLTIDLFDRVKALKSLSWEPSDGHLVAAATELHRTSTGLGGRGKGFRDMKKFVDTCHDGELWVLSNRGSYAYIKNRDQIVDRSSSIGGTIIQWRVRHSELLEVEDV
ncbi:hypothetical protein [Rhodopseudomonas palustris]|uniref:hypothetical protein n=1 Tax=Rhodopseudomonas palustris TaxID=1076 RepID=UPI0021F38020|nr:hypothetical protein [Rhodopseudomonas palustris]UYO51673.1 hypothetical protein KQX61_13675 [Rhodopseudomonas palustris]